MTIRQRRRAKLIGKNSTTEAELLAAGYAPSTAKHQPPSVMKAKGWNELMEKALPDHKLLKVHKEGLEATKQLSVRGGKDANAETDDFIEVPDYQTRAKYLELGYKIKHKSDEPNTLLQQNFYTNATKTADTFMADVENETD